MARQFKKTLPIAVATVLVLVSLPLSTLFPVAYAGTDYLEIEAKGGSMYPTIKNGDMVMVQIPADSESIEVGDIIMYGSIAAMAYVPNLQGIFISHRVTEKYQKDGHWCFRTKGDNNSEVDPWEVPDYWVTGIVVGIASTGGSTSETVQTQPTSNEQFPVIDYDDEQIWIGVISGIIGVIVMLNMFDKKRRMTRGGKIKVQACYDCQHYQAQYFYALQKVSGRLGIQKILDVSRAFCKYHHTMIFRGHPKQGCKAY